MDMVNYCSDPENKVSRNNKVLTVEDVGISDTRSQYSNISTNKKEKEKTKTESKQNKKEEGKVTAA